MVFQRCLPPYWRTEFTGSHLCYTCRLKSQCQAIVKVHRVFPSFCGYTAFSPRRRRLPGLQFGASLALTPPFNLPAPGRRQSVYVVCKTSHRPMFLVNSCPHLFSATLPGLQSKFFTRRSTPYSEVTGLFCRVPWPEFSRAPWIIHPTHLSWFPVRFA